MVANGRPVAKAAELIEDDAELEAAPAHPWVGRGALKLAHALDLWPVAVEGRVVLGSCEEDLFKVTQFMII